MQPKGPWASTGLLVLALALGTGPASAAMRQDPATVSSDAQHWTTSLDTALLDQAHRWVPGDTQTVTVWVRNLSREAATLNVTTTDEATADKPTARDARQRGRGASEVPLEVSVRVDGRPVRIGDDIGHRIAGAVPARVDLTITMPRTAGNRTQGQRNDVRLRVRLTQRSESTSTGPFGSSDVAGLSVPVAGRHVTTTGALPVGVPLTLAAVALAVRTALRGRRTTHLKEDFSCPQP